MSTIQAHPKGFNLIGYATSPLGLGEDLRSFAAMLDYLDIPFSVIDIPTESQRQVKVSWKNLSQADFDVSIFFMSASTCLRLAKAQPRLFSTPKLKIGYFLWELPDFPKKHYDALRLMDQIWCPTKFVQSTFFNATKKLILSIPLPVIKHPSSGRDYRRQLGIPSEAFVSLFIFDIHSTLNRKNPQGTIEAFLKTITDDRNHYLILKINRANQSIISQHHWLPDHPQIKYITDALTPEQLTDLYGAADCYLSLHRSEGFGRTLVEALQHGLTVVSTNFSGPQDFLNEENAKIVKWQKKVVLQGEYPDCDESWWAEPSISDAVIKLKEARNELKLTRENRGNQYSVENLATKYRPILQSYLR
jgi:glycosyltransferase involved in cell wall biosynthesis